MLLEEQEKHLDEGSRLILASHREEHDTIVESFPLRQMKADALRGRRLTNTRHAEDSSEPIFDDILDYLLHFALSSYEF